MDAQLSISLHQLWQTVQYDHQILLVFSLLLVLPCLYLLLMFYNTPKLNLPPSPPKLPIIGNLHQLSILLHHSLQSLSHKYGPVMLILMGKAPTLAVSSADAAREIMQKHDVSFSCRPQTRATNALFSGCTDVAFSPYSEYWRAVKKICVQQLLSQRRVQEFQFVREEEVAAVVEMIRVKGEKNLAVDLSEILLTLSNNIISRSALGKVYEVNGCEREHSLGRLSRKAIDLISTFCFKDMFRFLGWMDFLTGLVSSLKRTSKALHDVLDQVIEEHVRVPGEKRDLVDILLQLQRDGMLEIDLSRENLRAILMDMFVGGTDTTSAVMEWAMSQLVKNPPIMKKAQEEIRKVVGTKQKIKEAELNQMPYLKSILKETLRLHAPAMIARETSEAVKLQGYDIPSKTRVLVNAWAIQRDPTTWGDDAGEFIPERFAGASRVDFKGQHSEFIPFGFGRRMCPGMGFAVAEAELVLANLLCWFDWRLPDGEIAGDLDLSETNALIVHKKKPLVLIPNCAL